VNRRLPHVKTARGRALVAKGEAQPRRPPYTRKRLTTAAPALTLIDSLGAAGGTVQSPIKTPDELLKYRSLRQILADRHAVVHSVGPSDTVLGSLEQMAAHNVGFLVVLEQGALVGVLSERDYARKVILQGRASKDTPVRDIMTRDVVTVGPDESLSQCMALMRSKGFRHLPVVQHGNVVGVLSIRDLLSEIVAHHERVIRDLEIERLAMMGGGSTY
jgi:CBS domain-containing protein